ncbi:MAG: PEPxxWA-CTERM sorting domain-containing protein [Afipia sp.]|nr:PEPxxWA-CTERM sorting domain-containing protein [Afipia sp.]
MRMRSIVGGLAAALFLSSAASAAATLTIHAEGAASGHLASFGVIYPNPVPITVDATFDFSKGTRSTNAVVDRIDGTGANSPGDANVSIFSFGQMAEAGWGGPFAAMSFLDATTSSTFAISMLDPTSDRLLFLIVNRPGDVFTSLNNLPTGEVCSGANSCFGGIVDPDGGTTGNDLQIEWSTVSLSVQNTAVPEPATWALMILGFASAGAALRRSKALAQAA